MKKTFFLALASLAFAVGFTCCGGGGGISDVSPAALFFKGQTIEATCGSVLRFEFSDELWGYSTNVVPCIISASGVAPAAANITIKEYTLAEGSSEDDEEPEFATMKLMVQYTSGAIPTNDPHKAFWGYPLVATEMSLGGNGAEMDLVFTTQKNGVFILTVKAGAKFSVPDPSSRIEYVVVEDNVYKQDDADDVELRLGGNGTFTFEK